MNINLVCRIAGVPAPESEHRFHPVRKWRFDYAWTNEKLALEIEGGTWTKSRHTSGKGYRNDCIKYSTAAIMGWRVIRCTTCMINDMTVVELLQMAFKKNIN